MEHAVKDVRREPLKFGGYSIGCGSERTGEKWHVSVRIEKRYFLLILRHFSRAAESLSKEELIHALNKLPFDRFAPVRRQIFTLIRHVNRVRQRMGLSAIERERIDFRRRPVSPFEG
jgi:hypothetical protein